METRWQVLLGIYALVCSGLVLNGCSPFRQAPEQTDPIRTEQEVRLAFDELVAAARNLDIERYFQSFDDSKFIGLSAGGTVWDTIEDLRDVVGPGFEAVDEVESLVFTKVEISVIDPDTAVLVNEFQQISRLKNGTRVESFGGGSQVWSKGTGAWKLVSVSASSKPNL